MQTVTHPCKCGFHGDPFHQYLCTPHQIQTYRSKVSGPLMDRIDIHIEVPAIKFNEIASDTLGEPSLSIRERVTRARTIQQERFTGDGIYANAQMKPRGEATIESDLEDAEFLLSGTMSPRSTIKRAHDALFYAVLALLVNEPNATAKHTGVPACFKKNFII